MDQNTILDSLEQEFQEWLEQHGIDETAAVRSLDLGHAGGCG
ncbi:hypothetical protein [Streptomyces sp. NRRL WC-3742]|nr:hypothetical protein [Streptomyces sp. NRRL WC-3742]